MKLRIADEPNEPEYRDQYVLTAGGYYGDMDANFRVEESEGIDYLLDGYDLLKKLHDDSHFKYSAGDENHPGCELVPTDEWDNFPTVEWYALTWYNEAGVPYNVEVDCD